MHTTLIDVFGLQALAARGDVVVCDCRFDLSRPHWGRAQYLEAHIPGALFVDLDQDLSGPALTDAGRHPLPSEQAMVDLFSRLGVDSGVQVVAYDQREGATAARLWWMLRYMGHDAAAVLDGGFAAWTQAGLAVGGGEERAVATRFRGTARRDRLVVLDQVASAPVLIDARQGQRYRGEMEPLDPVAGHIPGARSAPFADNLDEEGRFLPAAAIRARLETTLAGVAPADAVYYCGSGVTACHLLLAAEHAGLDEGKLYVGSFSEWCRDPCRPVATGAEPG